MDRRRPGRPRSQAARAAVIAGTVAIIEEDGYAKATMERIARRAGVSKQTVYKWWSSPAEIVLEALNESAEHLAPLPDGGVLEDDLRAFVRRTVRGVRRNGRLLSALMAEAQIDPEFGEAFRAGFLARRREIATELLERAQKRGALNDPGLNIDFVVECFLGSVWYRLLAGSGALNRRFADDLTDLVLTAIGDAG